MLWREEGVKASRRLQIACVLIRGRGETVELARRGF